MHTAITSQQSMVAAWAATYAFNPQPSPFLETRVDDHVDREVVDGLTQGVKQGEQAIAQDGNEGEQSDYSNMGGTMGYFVGQALDAAEAKAAAEAEDLMYSFFKN